MNDVWAAYLRLSLPGRTGRRAAGRFDRATMRTLPLFLPFVLTAGAGAGAGEVTGVVDSKNLPIVRSL